LRGEAPPPIVRFFRRYRLEAFLGLLVTILFADYLFSDKLLWGSDSIPGGLFFRSLLVNFVKEFHELPRWNPYILGGLPFLDATHGDTFFPSSLLQFVMPVYRGMGHKLLLHIFLAGVFMAFYLRSLELHARAVAFGALAYMLSPVFVSYLFAGQDGKMYVTSLFPLVMGLLERAMASARPRPFLGLGFAIGLTILSAQIQMAYHAMWFAGALFVLRLFVPRSAGENRVRRPVCALLFAGSVVLGLFVAAIQLLPAVAYVKHPAQFSVRSDKTDYEHASSWSLHPEELVSMVVPEFCNSPDGYWGRNPFKHNSDYVGILTLFLAGLSLARRRDSTRLFLAGLSSFAILYSLGGNTPLHKLFYHVVPQVKLFRAPPLVMFGAAFGICALAAHALHDLESEDKRGRKSQAAKLLAWGLGIAALPALLSLAGEPLSRVWNELFFPGMEEAKLRDQLANLPALRRGALVAALVLATGTLLVHARTRGALGTRALFIGLMALTVGDLWRVDTRFKIVFEPERYTVPGRLLAPLELESKKEKFRVMPTVLDYAYNQMGLFAIESALGFHDNELSWYRELRSAPESRGLLAANAAGDYPFLRFLNVKYVLHDSPSRPNPLEVEGFLPRFWLVESWKRVGARSEIPRLALEPGFDPATTVLLEEDPGLPGPPGVEVLDPPGTVRAYTYRGNRIDVEVASDRPCLLVHSENWFPYWHVYEGDRELPLLRANGTIRAVPLTPGNHALEFRFRSTPYEAGRWVSFSALLVIVLALLGSAIRRPRAGS
jgi:hypothetical protein